MVCVLNYIKASTELKRHPETERRFSLMRTVLRCYKLREIERPSFRDALCSRIAQQVTAARIAYGESICIEFADGSAIQISLQDAAYLGAEAVSFDTGKEE